MAEGKTFVPVIGHFVAFLAVGADPADIRHKHARFARNIGPHVPGVCQRTQGAVADFVDMCHPRILCVLVRFDDCK